MYQKWRKKSTYLSDNNGGNDVEKNDKNGENGEKNETAKTDRMLREYERLRVNKMWKIFYL